MVGRVRGLAGRDDNGGGDFAGLVLAVDGVEHLLAVDRHFLGGHDPETDLIAPDLNDRHGDVVVDDDTFVFFPGQYEHRRLSFAESRGRFRLGWGFHVSGPTETAFDTPVKIRFAWKDPGKVSAGGA